MTATNKNVEVGTILERTEKPGYLANFQGEKFRVTYVDGQSISAESLRNDQGIGLRIDQVRNGIFRVVEEHVQQDGVFRNAGRG